MAYWLIKSEPNVYGWDHLVAEKRTHWDGVRNFQARKNLRAMGKGDLCLFYHSIHGKEIVGIARVVKEAYQDPTTSDTRWVAVDVVPVKKLPKAVPLSTLRENRRTADMKVVRQSRLSVSPVTDKEYEAILDLAGARRPRKKT